MCIFLAVQNNANVFNQDMHDHLPLLGKNVCCLGNIYSRIEMETSNLGRNEEK